MNLFNNFSEKDIQKARVYAASIDRKCAAAALSPDYVQFADHVTEEDKKRYSENCLAEAEKIENGERDHTFYVWQRMNYYLTGETVPFLPKTKK